MLIKLCGFTNQETVNLAVRVGVDFIGFVFYPPSKRNISPQKSGEIAKNIPSAVKKVAVIVDSTDFEIEQIIQHLKPDFLQIHHTQKQRVLEIKYKFQVPIIKAFSISSIEDLEAANDYELIADYFLFDTKTSEIGGSGNSFDWKIMDHLTTQKKWFLSGGLNISNIEKAITTTRSKMIDLSSGIEEIKGIKSSKLITEFINKVRSLSTLNT